MLTFIRDTIQQLKSEYGESLIVGKVTIIEQNIETGKIKSNTDELKIRKAIRLPNQMSLDFLKTVNSVKVGGVASGEFKILVDKQDVPKSFPVLTVDYAEFQNQRLDIVAFDDYPHALILHVKQTAGAERVGIRKNSQDTFTFIENLTNAD